MVNKSLISIVIPSYNSEKFITRCLTSLISQKADIENEIIVVDSSKDDTPKIVREKFPSVKLIHLDKQALPGAARNFGVRKAKGDILAFIDSDCIAHPNWISSVVKGINQGYSIVGGAVENATPYSFIGIADYILTFNEFLPGMPKRDVTFLPTCNFICRKDVFEDIGGFPPDWAAGEDFLFCYKASQKHKLLFTQSVLVSHINREHFKKFLIHHYDFGKHGAMTRKKLKLPGTIFTKHHLLALLIPFVRFLRISWRIVRWNKSMLPQFILTLPLVMMGIISWSFGFIRGGVKIN